MEGERERGGGGERWRGREVEGERGGGGERWRGREVEGERGGGGERWRGREVEGERGGGGERWRGREVEGERGGGGERWRGREVEGERGGGGERWRGGGGGERWREHEIIQDHASMPNPPVGLEAELVITGDLTQVSLQLLKHLLVAPGLLKGGKGVQAGELRHGDWKKLCSGIELECAGTLWEGGREGGREGGERGGLGMEGGSKGRKIETVDRERGED